MPGVLTRPIPAWLQILPDRMLVLQGKKTGDVLDHLVPLIQMVEKSRTGEDLNSHSVLVTGFIIRDKGAF